MSEGVFLDRTRPPTRAELLAVLDDRMREWDQLVGWIESTYGVEPEPLFSGKDTGWVIRYRRSGKSLVLMMPMPGALKVVVVIGPSVADRVAELELQTATRRAFEAAHPYPDGRWLSLLAATPRDVEDITQLIALKSPPPRRPRPRVVVPS
jgi:hypothetical protein